MISILQQNPCMHLSLLFLRSSSQQGIAQQQHLRPLAFLVVFLFLCRSRHGEGESEQACGGVRGAPDRLPEGWQLAKLIVGQVHFLWVPFKITVKKLKVNTELLLSRKHKKNRTYRPHRRANYVP